MWKGEPPRPVTSRPLDAEDSPSPGALDASQCQLRGPGPPPCRSSQTRRATSTASLAAFSSAARLRSSSSARSRDLRSRPIRSSYRVPTQGVGRHGGPEALPCPTRSVGDRATDGAEGRTRYEELLTMLERTYANDVEVPCANMAPDIAKYAVRPTLGCALTWAFASIKGLGECGVMITTPSVTLVYRPAVGGRESGSKSAWPVP